MSCLQTAILKSTKTMPKPNRDSLSTLDSKPSTHPETTTPSTTTTTTTTTIPPLTTHQATTETDLTTSLHLIADSVAQQRQQAARALIFHPLSLGILLIPLAIVYKVLYRESNDWALIGTTWAGCVMVGLVAVRGVVSGYLDVAERTGTWRWLYSSPCLGLGSRIGQREKEGERGEEKEKEDVVVLVTKFGDKIVGTVVLRAIPISSPSSGVSTAISTPSPVKQNKKESPRRTAKIRAWTIHHRYRRHGLGTALLEEAVKLCRERNWDGPVFDENHANSVRLLPGLFNGGFERVEGWGRGCLGRVKSQQGE